MRTELCDRFGIDVPIFAFSHCRDVVAAVSKAGGMGVLGALAFSPEQLEIELNWIDEHVDGKPYGVDVVMPAKYVGKEDGLGERSPARSTHVFEEMIPERHRTGSTSCWRARRAAAAGRAPSGATALLGWTDERRAQPGRGRARAPDQAARERARAAAEGRDRPRARARHEGRGAGRHASSTRCARRRRASTSSSRRAPRPAATPARSARWC